MIYSQFAGGQRSGLVEDKRADLRSQFQVGYVLDKNAQPGGGRERRHDCGG